MKKVSELLRDERIKQGYSLADVQRVTKIKQKFLKAIEEGTFYGLPSEAYALGFVKSYAAFLGLPTFKITAYFRREYAGEGGEYLLNFRKSEEHFRKLKIVTPKRVAFLLIVIAVSSYIFFQYSSLFFGPWVEILVPKQGEEYSQNIIRVEGKTDPYATVAVDGDEVYVGIDGKFSKSLYVFSGEKKIVIIAKNRFGKETRREVMVRVK